MPIEPPEPQFGNQGIESSPHAGHTSSSGAVEFAAGAELGQCEAHVSPDAALPGLVRAVRGRRNRVRDAVKRCITSATSPFTDGPNDIHTTSHVGDKNDPATSTPLPDSSPRLSGGGNGGNGGNGGRKKKNGGSPGSGEHPAVVESSEVMTKPSRDIETAKHLLEKRHGIRIETPALFDTTANQREYRERLFGPNMWRIIHELQQRPDLKAIESLDPSQRVERYYAVLAAADAYKGGEITEKNLGKMFGLEGEELMQLFCSIEGETVTRKNSVELAPGNGEMSRMLADLRDKYLALAHIHHGLPEKGKVTRDVLQSLLGKAFTTAANSPKTVDRHISAVDVVQKFADKARRKLINGQRADICSSPEVFFEATGLQPNSQDFIFMNLAFDRIPNVHAAMRLMKMLAKMDGSTQFMFGFFAPFSRHTESFSKSENVPEFECFDPTVSDIRDRWIGLSRPETIYRIITDLNLHGFHTKRAGEHEYEVYSPHCITEPAGVLRTDSRYAFLKTYDFKDEQLNARRDDVFNGKIPDSDLVGFPERTPIVLHSGNITMPEDASKYVEYANRRAA